ncbi:hypothetical protein ACI2JA_15520 [Alkalihalobacillus sp. NPDC078783]
MKKDEPELDLYDAIAISVGATLVVVGLFAVVMESFGFIRLWG